MYKFIGKNQQMYEFDTPVIKFNYKCKTDEFEAGTNKCGDNENTSSNTDDYISSNKISVGTPKRVQMGYKGQFDKLTVFKRSRTKVFSSDQTQAVPVFKMLDKFPKGLSSQAKDIYITSKACEADKEKSVKYGKVFISAATHQLGGFGSSKRDTIVKWNSNKSPLTEDILAHELAHSLDCSDGQYGYSSSNEYKEAFNKDGNKFVTPYAKKSYDVYNNDKYDKVMLFVEDFAEAIKLYVTDPNFSTSYPNRAKYFNKIIKR